MKKSTTVMLGILTTLGEMKHGAPAGHLYAALMSQVSYQEFIEVLINLVDNDLVTNRNHYVELTAKGLALADKVNAALARLQAEKESAG